MEELDLKELFNIFWSKKGLIILSIVIFSVIGYVYSYTQVTPKYKASTTLILTTSADDSKSAETITTTDITLNNNLVATYSELAKSKTVVRQVINNLGLNETEDQIRASISVSSVKSTQLIQVDVVNDNPLKAKIIANEVAKVFMKQVSEYYNLNNVHVVDAAEEPTSPYNINHNKDIAIFAAIGFVIACAYAFIRSLIDTTIKGKDEVEKKLGISVLVSIPKCNFEESLKAMNSGKKRR